MYISGLGQLVQLRDNIALIVPHGHFVHVEHIQAHIGQFQLVRSHDYRLEDLFQTGRFQIVHIPQRQLITDQTWLKHIAAVSDGALKVTALKGAEGLDVVQVDLVGQLLLQGLDIGAV